MMLFLIVIEYLDNPPLEVLGETVDTVQVTRISICFPLELYLIFPDKLNRRDHFSAIDPLRDSGHRSRNRDSHVIQRESFCRLIIADLTRHTGKTSDISAGNVLPADLKAVVFNVRGKARS